MKLCGRSRFTHGSLHLPTLAARRPMRETPLFKVVGMDSVLLGYPISYLEPVTGLAPAELGLAHPCALLLFNTPTRVPEWT